MTEGESTGQRQGDADARLERAFDQMEQKNLPSHPFSILATILALIAIGMGSYTLYTVHAIQAPAKDPELAAVRRKLIDLEQKTGQAGIRLESLAERISGLETTIPERMETLKQTFESRIAEIPSGTSSQDWLMAEVEYLLRMANQRILMDRDPEGALGLFRAADRIIADSRELTAFDLRRALAEDIARLEAVQDLDREGIYLRLSALMGEVDRLRRPEMKYEPPEMDRTNVDPEGASLTSRAFEFMMKAGRRLASLVDYRRDVPAITPVLPPEEEYYLRQNLVHKLEIARMALLAGRGEVYRLSLDEALEWVQGYFDPEDAVSVAMVRSLQELKAIDVDERLPDVTGSLEEARKLMAGFHQAEDKP